MSLLPARFLATLYHEDEGHVLFECPLHAQAHAVFFQGIAKVTRESIEVAGSGEAKLLQAQRHWAGRL